jgi:hypothetical protein
MENDRVHVSSISRWAVALLLTLAVLTVALLWDRTPDDARRPLGESGESRAVAGDAGIAAELRFDRAGDAIAIPERELPAVADWITVRVVDVQGSAVPDLEVGRSTEHRGVRIEFVKERTDARGECRFGIGAQERAGASEQRRYSFVVDAPVGRLVERDFDPRDPPREPVVLTVEMGGRLEIIACNAVGEPHDGPVTIWIRDLDRRDLTPLMYGRFDNVTFAAARGRVTTPPLALGRRWRITVEPAVRTHAAGYLIAEGPAFASETKSVRVPLGVERPFLAARFVDEEGGALAEATFGAALICDGDVLGVDASPADARERVCWPLPLRTTRAKRVTLFVWSPMSSPTRIATYELPAPLAAGTLELGDIACAEIPLGASGQVVDAAGTPLSDAGVQLFGGRSGQSEISPYSGTITDEEGRFALRILPSQHGSALIAGLPGYRQTKLTGLAYGTPDALSLRIVLRRGGSVSGSVLIDSDAAPCLWGLQLRRSPSGALGAQEWISFEASGERFLLEDIEAGTYTLRFGCRGAIVADVRASSSSALLSLHEIEGLRVLEGRPCSDPRLESVDLRGKLRRREIRVLDPEGQPFGNRHLGFSLRTTDGVLHTHRGHSTDDQGWLRISAPPMILALELGVRGHRIVTLDPTALTQTVRLERGLPVRIELAADAAELPAGFEYTVVLVREEPDDEWVAWFGDDAAKFFARRGSAAFEVDLPAPGRYGLHWSLRRGEGSNEPASELEGGSVEVIEVREQSEVQSFRCTPPAAAIDAALLRFDRE